jgi:hypothetical protein
MLSLACSLFSPYLESASTSGRTVKNRHPLSDREAKKQVRNLKVGTFISSAMA